MIVMEVMKQTMKNDVPHIEMVNMFQKENDKDIDIVVWKNEQNNIFNVIIDLYTIEYK